MAISPRHGLYKRFVNIVRTEGVGTAGLDAFRYLLPDRVTAIPEIDFTLRSLRDYVAAPTGPPTAITGFRHGFFPSSARVYDFGRYGTDAYVSDYARTHQGWAINGTDAEYLDDKGQFDELLRERGFDRYLPRVYGRIVDGIPTDLDGSLEGLIRTNGPIVIKGRRGGGGTHVHVCRATDDGIRVDNEYDLHEWIRRVSADQEYLVTEFCEPGSYVREIFPDAVSTVRAITVNPFEGDPFIAHLTHKIGTRSTAPMDTFGDGGISVHMDETGRLGSGVRIKRGRYVPCMLHPDTGEKIPGTMVPHWPTIRDNLLTLIDTIPEFRYVGWDIVITDDAEFTILEGNANPGIEVQYHEPMLLDSRVTKFFDDVGFRANATPLDRLSVR